MNVYARTHAGMVTCIRILQTDEMDRCKITKVDQSTCNIVVFLNKKQMILQIYPLDIFKCLYGTISQCVTVYIMILIMVIK